MDWEEKCNRFIQEFNNDACSQYKLGGRLAIARGKLVQYKFIANDYDAYLSKVFYGPYWTLANVYYNLFINLGISKDQANIRLKSAGLLVEHR